jgi:hypothetical protein
MAESFGFDVARIIQNRRRRASYVSSFPLGPSGDANSIRYFPHYRVGGFMNYSKSIIGIVLILLISSQAFAQQQPTPPTGSSQKYRAILTIAGAGGGAAAGLFIGLAKFDDATYSERKVTTAAIVGGAGGAVGGYFLGRVLDRRRDRANAQRVPRTVQVSPLVSRGTKGVQFSISF